MGNALYPHLSGDLDANPTLLARLEKLAADASQQFVVTSGRRSTAEQTTLWNNRANNPYPVAKPGTSVHETGNAADVTVDGRPIQDAFPSLILEAAGLKPLKGDAVHVELAGTPSYVNGGLVGGAAGAVQDAGQAINNGANDLATGAAAAAAKATASAIVGLVVDAIGRDGARVLLSIGFVIAAVLLIGYGIARATGADGRLKQALGA